MSIRRTEFVFRIESIDFNNTTVQNLHVPPDTRANLNEVKVRGTYFGADGSETEINTPLSAEEYEVVSDLMKRVRTRIDASLSKL